MNGTRWVQVGVWAGLLLVGGDARAAATPPGAEGDREFLAQALGVNEVELHLARLAAERGATAEVKAAGAKMIEKHTELGGRLRQLAEEAGIPGDAVLSPDQRASVARVESKTGAEFDDTFRRTVDDGHVQELAMYREEVGRAFSPRLRSLAEQRVAALQSAVAAAGKLRAATR